MTEHRGSDGTTPERPAPRRSPRRAAGVIAGVAVVGSLVVIGLLAVSLGVPLWLALAVVAALCGLVVLAFVLG